MRIALAVFLLSLAACGDSDSDSNTDVGGGSDIGPSDFDLDGIVNTADRCPTEPETVNGFEDEDGCPDTPPVVDSDRDGIPDSRDGCPNEPENLNGFQDTDGCPDSRINDGFDGTWIGPMRIVTIPFGTLDDTGELQIDILDDTFRVRGFCPSGDGVAVVQGASGLQVTWPGAYSCLSIAFPLCDATELRYENATFTLMLGTPPRLALGATGTASCFLDGILISEPFAISTEMTRLD